MEIPEAWMAFIADSSSLNTTLPDSSKKLQTQSRQFQHLLHAMHFYNITKHSRERTGMMCSLP